MMQPRPALPLVLALLVTGSAGADPKPVDGGFPLDFDRSPEVQQILERDPCRRRERDGWHYSIGHCEAMSSPERMTGVWVTAFEEASFFPNATAIPDANDPLRFTQTIELNEAQIHRLTGLVSADLNGNAYLLTFIGRRTRDPTGVDCTGMPSFGVVVDRLISAHHLGPMGPFNVEDMRARSGRVEQRHSGRWGQLEAEAVERCFAHPSGEADEANGARR